MVTVHFYSLVGKLAVIRQESFVTESDALLAVRVYAESAGYSNVKTADNDDPYTDDIRVTAKTPGGRNGRNVATIYLEPSNYPFDRDCGY